MWSLTGKDWHAASQMKSSISCSLLKHFFNAVITHHGTLTKGAWAANVFVPNGNCTARMMCNSNCQIQYNIIHTGNCHLIIHSNITLVPLYHSYCQGCSVSACWLLFCMNITIYGMLTFGDYPSGISFCMHLCLYCTVKGASLSSLGNQFSRSIYLVSTPL